jgi:Cu/Zn superoxide dismutase
VYQAARLAGSALGIALLTLLTLGGSVAAQGAETMELQLTPSRDSGVSGTATITEAGDGIRVELNMRGLPKAGIEHINHFHEGGTCTADRAGNVAPATIPLETIVAKEDGTGSATTTLKDVTLDSLFDPDKKRYIALHSEVEKGQGVPPVISCADLVDATVNSASLNDKTVMMGETTMMVSDIPASGGPAILLPTAALLVGAGVLGYAVLRRNM